MGGDLRPRRLHRQPRQLAGLVESPISGGGRIPAPLLRLSSVFAEALLSRLALRLSVLGRMLTDGPEEIVPSCRNFTVPMPDICESPSRLCGWQRACHTPSNEPNRCTRQLAHHGNVRGLCSLGD